MSCREIEGASTIHIGGEDDVSLPLPWKGNHLILSREVKDHQVALAVVLAQVGETGGIFLLKGVIQAKGQRGLSPPQL
jgi:hypothetical protein